MTGHEPATHTVASATSADRWTPNRVATALAARPELDDLAAALQRLGAPLVRAPVADAVLGGEALVGHPVHPLLTDLPIGFWTSVMVLDLVGGRRARSASELLLLAGVLSAAPTVLAGLHDAATIDDAGMRRVAVVHAAANSIATGLYLWSWRQRRSQRWLRGATTAMVAAALATLGGLLGGALVYGDRAGSDGEGSGGSGDLQ